MTDFLILVGFILGAIALLGLALSIGLIWKGRPVSHCGGASRAKGEDCPVCGGAPSACTSNPKPEPDAPAESV